MINLKRSRPELSIDSSFIDLLLLILEIWTFKGGWVGGLISGVLRYLFCIISFTTRPAFRHARTRRQQPGAPASSRRLPAGVPGAGAAAASIRPAAGGIWPGDAGWLSGIPGAGPASGASTVLRPGN